MGFIGDAGVERVAIGLRIHGGAAGSDIPLFLELARVVTPPELRRRPGLVRSNANDLQAFHPPQQLQAFGNSFWG